MGIEMIEQNNGELLAEYKIPDFINETSNTFENNSRDYEILQVLGGGAFSKVLKVKSKTNYGIFAMKKVDMDNIIKEEGLSPKYFENEAILLKKLDHPNIIKCYKIFREKQYLYFIMEFMNNGDLSSYNDGIIKMNVKIPEGKLWEIFYKCLLGLDYIHKQNIIHRDIKLQNLFLDDNYNIKIGDFNISSVIDKDSAKKFTNDPNQIDNLINQMTTLGTKGYQAPEIGINNYDSKVDIYSMGVSFFELSFGVLPNKVIIGKKDENNYSKELKSFILKMLDIDKNKRPTSNEAMMYAKHQFIKYYVKNSSVESTLYCFYSFPNFNQYFSNNEVANFIFENNKEFSSICMSIIQCMKFNDISQMKLNLYDLRKSLEKEGLNIQSDNKEVDAGNVIIFFIRKLNSELNEIMESNKLSDEEEKRRFKLLSKNYCFPPNEEEIQFNQIINAYNLKILSFISRNFFSFIKTKRTCLNCQNSSCSFSKLFFIPININILKKKLGAYCNLSLKNAIDTLKNSSCKIDVKKGIACQYCKSVSEYKETRNFYHTARNLIILFDRGENSANDSFVDFDANLRLNRTEVERYNEVNYQLTGIISKKKEEYISLILQDNIWISSKGEKLNFFEAKNYGTVIALFYNSDEPILILKSLQNNLINNNQNNQQPVIFENNNQFQNQNPIMINNQNNNLQQNVQNFNQINNNQQFNNISVNRLQQIYNNIQWNNFNNANNINNLNNNNNNNFQINKQNPNPNLNKKIDNPFFIKSNNNNNNNNMFQNNNFNNNLGQNIPKFNINNPNHNNFIQNNQIPQNFGNNNINNNFSPNNQIPQNFGNNNINNNFSPNNQIPQNFGNNNNNNIFNRNNQILPNFRNNNNNNNFSPNNQIPPNFANNNNNNNFNQNNQIPPNFGNNNNNNNTNFNNGNQNNVNFNQNNQFGNFFLNNYNNNNNTNMNNNRRFNGY